VKQVVQSVSNGDLRVVDVPQPDAGPTEVLVATRRSLLSAGTERAVRKLASASMLQKAKARPDLVRQVVAKARTDGVRSTVTAVRGRLDEDMPLGYSAAGVAIAVGSAVGDVRPGMRVATASAGHAEYQVVPGLLAVPIPDSVSDEAAAFGAVAGIALQGLRQAAVGVGGTVAVVGLGLVGQLTVRLATAAGLTVVGIDLRDWTTQYAEDGGAVGLVENGSATTDQVRGLTRGRGVDAVLITAATPSSDPVLRATELTRDRGRIVVVGDVGLKLDRRPFYEQELDLRFARSYGPGRYDRSYEEWGVDYPIGHVRWTEGRNIEAYLDLLAQGRVSVEDLITHVFDIGDATKAYDTLDADSRALAVQLSYSAEAVEDHRPVVLRPRGHVATTTAGIIGAGNYAKATFLPALKQSGWAEDLRAITSAKGLTARHLAERYGIGLVMSGADDLLAIDDVHVVFVLSRHDSHADLVVKALDAGKHVFVEKPLAISRDELQRVEAAYARNDGHLVVGFNRRFSAMTERAKELFASGDGPITVSYRINAGRLPQSHWYKDRRQGGRIIGEVCHFIDLASWIIAQPVSSVYAVGSGRGEAGMEEDVTILLGYPDGSAATITYSTGAHASTPKESVEIVGRGHTVAIDDFRHLRIDGQHVRGVPTGKGHAEQLSELRTLLMSSGDVESHHAADVMATATALCVLEFLLPAPSLPGEGAL
jgi:predicted dehydrogenase/threonine dehydrogenase-like Zn-dependent dehydrogenase